MNGNNYFDGNGDFKSDSEFKGFVKAKLEDSEKRADSMDKKIDTICSDIKVISEKAWTTWGMILGISAIVSVISSMIFNIISKKV